MYMMDIVCIYGWNCVMNQGKKMCVFVEELGVTGVKRYV